MAVDDNIVFGLEAPTSQAIMELARTTSQSFCDVLITPHIADLLLTLNTGNRPIRKRQLANFNEILKEKRYVNTGEPVIISDEGILNEGQHRLTAVRDSGIPAVMDVRFGISRAAFGVTGTGAARSSGDTLALMGIPMPINTAAVAKLAHSYVKGLPGSYRWRLGTDLVVAAVERWPDLPDAPRILGGYTHSTYFRNAAAGCFLWLTMRAGQLEKGEQFLQAVVRGEGAATSPTKMLHSLMTGDLRLRLGDSEVIVEKLALFIIAWNAWLTGTRSPKLSWNRTQPYPVLPHTKF
jgi:hypothetical protein